MGFEYTEPKVVKTETVDGRERTIYEATFRIPMQMFTESVVGLSEADKKAVEPLIVNSIKETFQQTGRTLSEYMKGYNNFKETKINDKEV